MNEQVIMQSQTIEAAARLDALHRFDELVARLVYKVGRSQVPVPGFIVGLSGTDSILSFVVLARACQELGIPDRVTGVHYVDAGRRKPTWFEAHVVPWLQEWHPKAEIVVATPLGGNQDPQRWADLSLRSMHEIQVDDAGASRTRPRGLGQNRWVAGSVNATELALGRYTLLSTAVSIQPIATVWKSDVLRMCGALDVPQVAIDNARIPDCLCGRDEIAAENIDLIDEIVRLTVQPADHDPVRLGTLISWVADQKRENGFRNRVPYRI